MTQNTRQTTVVDETPTVVTYDPLERFDRSSIQTLFQRVLEEEVETLLGRPRSERRHPDSPTGYRDGYGKQRRLSTTIGTILVRRPQVRNTDEPFVSRVLPLFQCRTQKIGQILGY